VIDKNGGTNDFHVTEIDRDISLVIRSRGVDFAMPGLEGYQRLEFTDATKKMVEAWLSSILSLSQDLGHLKTC